MQELAVQDLSCRLWYTIISCQGLALYYMNGCFRLLLIAEIIVSVGMSMPQVISPIERVPYQCNSIPLNRMMWRQKCCWSRIFRSLEDRSILILQLLSLCLFEISMLLMSWKSGFSPVFREVPQVVMIWYHISLALVSRKVDLVRVESTNSYGEWSGSALWPSEI